MRVLDLVRPDTLPIHRLTMFAVVLLGAATARAQTTAFTYQGQLKNGGSPAAGNFDMTFRLFDADLKGNQIGSDVALNAVPVANGLFTTTVDFGAFFSGAPLWLEIQVSDQILSPRQPLTSAPYAQTASYSQSCNIANAASVADYANAPWVPSGSDLYFNTGNVGIGTTTPLGSLEVKLPGHTLISGGALGVTADTTPFPASAGRGVFLTGGGASANVFGFNYTTFQPLPLTLQTPGGNVGIGTSTPTDRLNVKTATNSYGITHTDGTIIVGTFVGGAGNGGYLGTRSNHPLHLFTADSGPLLTITTNGNVGIGTTTPGAKLEVSGRTITHSLQIIGGADLAEPFDVAGNGITPGMVVVIDPSHPGSLKPCSRAYDRKVAGIVSGAGGVATGLSMSDEGTLADGKHPIALSGRVYCLVDASQGTIEPGDMLTTSSVPGHAMKASDFDRARGAILGKAMTSLSAGKGLVFVLVNLQ